MTTHPCTVCATVDAHWGTGGEYGEGWSNAMRFAHHAHDDDTYKGHMSANGVLGAGTDAVIVDGDYLADLEERALHWLPRLDVRLRRWRHRIWATAWYARKATVCLFAGHKFTTSRYGFGTWCDRCGTHPWKPQ